MIGKQDRWQGELFVSGSLDQLIPDDHIRKRVDKVLDLSWLREEVRDCYDESTGRPGIDPESAVRLMLAGFFQGIVHDRKLMREAQVNLAICWFAGYRLHERLPDHSSLTRIRQRWGAARFRRIFERTVGVCLEAGLVSGETVHTDATLIRADVSLGSLTTRHAEGVLQANSLEEDPEDPGGGKRKPGRPQKHRKYPKKRSTTDPDCTMGTNQKNRKLEPCYKQHTTVDDAVGVVVDVELTTGEASEGARLLKAIERVEATTGRKVEHVTADATYAHSLNYEACEERGTEAVIPPMPEMRSRRRMPLRRFKYDGKHNRVPCPVGRVLRRSHRARNGWIYRARACDCRRCPHQEHCVSPGNKTRTVLIVDGYEALLRASRRKPRWSKERKRLYSRHRWCVEGVHGTGKTQHGLRRAIRRGLDNVAIQVYLTATVMNLKKLAASSWFILELLLGRTIPSGTRHVPDSPLPQISRLRRRERESFPAAA
jgi:transposase